jgi:hypothetical protein
LADVKTLQAGEPRMSFDEAWNRAMAANAELRQVEEVSQGVSFRLPALKSRANCLTVRR